MIGTFTLAALRRIVAEMNQAGLGRETVAIVPWSRRLELADLAGHVPVWQYGSRLPIHPSEVGHCEWTSIILMQDDEAQSIVTRAPLSRFIGAEPAIAIICLKHFSDIQARS